MENPEEEEKRRQAKEEARLEKKRKKAEEEERKRKDDEDLSVYMYDIETVEMLAASSGQDRDRPKIMKTQIDDEEKARHEAMIFNTGSAIRAYDHVAFEKPLLLRVDADDLEVVDIRALLEKLAVNEEKLERRLAKTRENLKDFSLLLTTRLQEEEDERYEQEEKQQRKLKAKADAAAAGGGEVGGEVGSQAMSQELDDESEEEPEGDEKEKNKDSDEDDDDDDDSDEDGSGTHAEEQKVDDVVTDIAALNALKRAKRGLTGDIISRSRHMPALLVGDVAIGDATASAMVTTDMVKATNNLALLALFCGYSNTIIDAAPDTLRSNLQQHLHASTFNRQEDDAWMTGNFFLTVSQERLDAIREALSLRQNPAKGYARGRGSSGAALHLDTLSLSKDIVDPPQEKVVVGDDAGEGGGE